MPEAPYRLWSKEGLLTICDGTTVNYHDVTEWFTSMVKEHNIRPLWIGYDRALAGYWAEEMTESGFEMEKIAQGSYTWTFPVEFVSAPTVTVGAVRWGTGASWGTLAGAPSTTQAILRGIDTVSRASGSTLIEAIAVGWWK